MSDGQPRVTAGLVTRGRRASLIVLLLASCGALASCAHVAPQASERVTAKDLVGRPALFDGRLVNVAGRITAIQLDAGARPAYSFSVDDGTQRVTVSARGIPACHAGAPVTVEGWFRAGAGPGFGHIEAITVACR